MGGPDLLIVRPSEDDEVVQIVLNTSPTDDGKQLRGGLLPAGSSQTRLLVTTFVCRVCGASSEGSRYFRCLRER